MLTHRCLGFGIAVAVICLSTLAFGQGSTQPSPTPIDFEKDIQPILTARCATAGCHVAGGVRPALQSGVALSNVLPLVTAGNPSTSRLVQLLDGTRTPKMPPGSPLTTAQFDLIQHWVSGMASTTQPPPTTQPPQQVPAAIQTIFTANCAQSGCHAGSTPASGMNLDASNAASNLIGVASREKPEFKRVDPARPGDSYLLQKIEGREGIGGSRMPLGRSPLSGDDVTAIRSWIAGLGQTQPPAGGRVNLVSFKVDGIVLPAGTETPPVSAGKHRFELAFDAPINVTIDPQTGDIDLEGAEVRIFPELPNPPTNAAPTADGRGFTGTVDLPANTTYQFFVLTNADNDDGTDDTFSEFYFGTTALSDAKVSGTLTLPNGAVNLGNGVAFLLSHPFEDILGSNASTKLARAAKRVSARLAQTGPGTDQSDSDQDSEDQILAAAVRIDILDSKSLSFSLPFVPDGTYYLAVVTDVQVGDNQTSAFGIYDIEGDGVSDPITVRLGQSVDGLEVAGFLTDQGGQPPPTGGGKVNLVSFRVDGIVLPAGTETPPILAGKHRFELAFDAPIHVTIDPQTGDIDLEGAEVRIFPDLPNPPTNAAPTADGKGFTGTVDLPPNTTYQFIVLTNVDNDDGTDETFSEFYFGTTALPDARVSGAITLPEEAAHARLGSGFAFLLTAPPEEVLGDEGSSKVVRAAKRVAARLMKDDPGPGEGEDEGLEDRLLRATLRVSLMQDASFSFLFVPNGQYYIVTIADAETNGQYGEVFGVYDIDGDGGADPIEVAAGRGVEGLEIATVLLGGGGEPPPPQIRGIVARVDLTQSQFAIGRTIEFIPDQVAVYGGQGGRISVRDLQPGFPVLVTFDPGVSIPTAGEIRILRPGQNAPVNPNQTTGTIDRVDAERIFLIEHRFQFDGQTAFVDADDNPIEARNLNLGDFVAVTATPRTSPPDYAAHVKVLPSGFAPGQYPDQALSAEFTTRTGKVPADGATSLPTNPQLQISFNGPVNQDFLDQQVEVDIFPYADDVFKSGPEARNGRLVAELNLKTDTAYTMWVIIYGGQKAPFAVNFTTGTGLPKGVVSGRLSLPSPKEIPGLPDGASLVLNPAGTRSAVLLTTQDPATALPLLDSGDYDDYVTFLKQIVGVGILQPNGNYLVKGVPSGSYYAVSLAYVFARQGPTGPPIDGTERQLRGFYDVAPGDGKADRVSVRDVVNQNVDIKLSPPPALKVVRATPAANSVNIPLKTTLSFTFNDRIAETDGVAQAEIAMFPEPESGPIQREALSLSDDGKTVSVGVELAGNTAYQAFVFYAESSNTSLLPVAELVPQTGFSTGPTVATGKISGAVEGIPGGSITRDAGLIYTYLIASSIDIRDLGPGDFDPLSAAFGASDGNAFGAQYIPEGKYYVLVEFYRFEDDTSLYGFLTDLQGKPRILSVARGQEIKGLTIRVSPTSSVGQETHALRLLNVQSFDGTNRVEIKDGVGGIPTKTQIVVTFSEPIQVSREFVGVDAELIPAAKTGDLFGNGSFRVQDQGKQVVFTVELASGTDYQFIIRGAVSESGSELRESEERFFTTKATRVALGSITGKISLSDGSRPRGSVFATVKFESNEVVIAQVDADTVYTFPSLPDGKYYITADLKLDSGLKLGGFYDKNVNKNRDDNDFVEMKSGGHLSGITIGPLTVPTGGPITGSGPNAKATVSLDFGKDKGDQGQTRLEKVDPASDVSVSVYVHGVKDLAGYTVTLGFDPKRLAFNGAESDNPAEGTNLLKTSGGVALFLPPAIKNGSSVEFGGAVLAATEATAPDGDGPIGVFRFKTTETFADSATITISRVVLKGVAGTDTLRQSVAATVSKTGGPLSSGGTPTPKAGDGTAMLDLDAASDDQKVQIKNGVKGGQRVDVQILLGKSYSNASGFQVVLKFDAAKVKVVGWKKDGESFASAIDLPAQTKADSVTYGASIFGGSTTATGSLAVLTFETLSDYTGDTEITLSTVQVRIAGGSPIPLKPGASVVLSSGGLSKPTPDFNGDGEVGFDDFFEFAAAFGQPATGANAKFDLDGDGEIGFGDFFEFAGAFGTTVSKKKPALSKPSGLGSLGANGEARLGLQVQPSDRQDAVTVDLSVSGARSLSGYGVDLEYDPSELEFVGSQPAGVFEAGAEGRPLLRSSDGLGRVRLGDAVPGAGVSGDVTVSRLTFRVRPGGGIGSLRLTEGMLLDGMGLVNPVGEMSLVGSSLRPLSYELSLNYPNPFNPATQVAYQVPDAGRVRLVVYNILGQRVRMLVDGHVEAGFYRTMWDGRDDQGRSVSSGVYLYRMDSGGFSQVHKMIMMK